jgi:hypothetical protein
MLGVDGMCLKSASGDGLGFGTRVRNHWDGHGIGWLGWAVDSFREGLRRIHHVDCLAQIRLTIIGLAHAGGPTL